MFIISPHAPILNELTLQITKNMTERRAREGDAPGSIERQRFPLESTADFRSCISEHNIHNLILP